MNVASILTLLALASANFLSAATADNNQDVSNALSHSVTVTSSLGDDADIDRALLSAIEADELEAFDVVSTDLTLVSELCRSMMHS